MTGVVPFAVSAVIALVTAVLTYPLGFSHGKSAGRVEAVEQLQDVSLTPDYDD